MHLPCDDVRYSPNASSNVNYFLFCGWCEVWFIWKKNNRANATHGPVQKTFRNRTEAMLDWRRPGPGLVPVLTLAQTTLLSGHCSWIWWSVRALSKWILADCSTPVRRRLGCAVPHGWSFTGSNSKCCVRRTAIVATADSQTCVIKWSCNQFGDHPKPWNNLPEQFRQPDITFRQFNRSLKTFVFS